MIKLDALPLTASDFTPFGDVVEASSAQVQKQINEGHTVRFDDLANVTSEGRITVNIFRTAARRMPVILHQMERHPKACQLFMPLGGCHSYLVVVAPAGDFKANQVRAFIAGPDQGVNYHAGTWHHYSLALGGRCDFLVIDYVDLKDNCDFITLPEPVQVVFGS